MRGDTNELRFIRETMHAEYKAREDWKRKYGAKFGDALSLPQSRSIINNNNNHHNNSTGIYDYKARIEEKNRQLRSKRDRTIRSFDLNVPDTSSVDPREDRLNAGLARFLGVYNPSLARTGKTSTKLEHSDLCTTMHRIEEFDRSKFRQKDWLKAYFEETAKAKQIIKSAGPASGGGADSKGGASDSK